MSTKRSLVISNQPLPMRTLRTLAALAALSGCAAHTRAAPLIGAGVAPSPNQKMSAEMTEALLHGDVLRAAAVVDAARRAAAPSRPSAETAAYWDAAVHSYGADYRGAAAVLSSYLAGVAQSDGASFRFHDALIALRTAQGDLLGAVVECEEMTKAGERGRWTPSDGDRMTLVRLKEHWHRAYLLRMEAQTISGGEREAFLRYAEGARQDYVALAAPLKTLGDSIAVLDAYFAFCDGDRAAMLSAARRVHVREDDDAEDLYLVQLAFDGGGDAASAAAVRERMRAIDSANVITPIYFGWMRSDDAAAQGALPRFSPKYPSAPAAGGSS